MFARSAFLPLVSLLAAGLWFASPASAKFVSPPDVVKDPALTNLLGKLKSAKTSEEAKPHFDSLAKISAEGGTPEQEFTLGYLYQYGIGTTADNAKAITAYQKAADAGNAAAKNNLGLLMLATGNEPAKGLSIIETLANTGDASAQCTMGQLYVDGAPALGMPKDLAKARTWFERAASNGDSDAAWAIAAMLVNKTGATPAEVKQAIPWLEKASKAGNLPALVNYGMRLATGNGMDADPTRGVSMLQSAMAKGSSQARVAMASLYETGGGVKKDLKKAFDLYTQAAESGDNAAYNKLGYLTENGLGVEKDEAKAAGYYKQGAEKNVGACLFNYAVFNDDGRGGLKKDPDEAFRLHYKGAMTGFVPCQLALGTRYRDGIGVEKDPQAALAWYQRAMQNGDLTGALNVAAIMENGTSGFVDNNAAASIYLQAANRGNPQALASLGAMIEDGRGVQGDFKQVYLLYSIGATAAVKGAEERLDQFKSRLSPAQVKEAETFTAANRDRPQAILPALNSVSTQVPAAPEAASAAPAPASSPKEEAPKPSAKPAAKGSGKSGSKQTR